VLAPGLVPVLAIDMSTSTGIKVWNTSMEPLEPQFDGAPGKIFGFLKQVQLAIVERRWTEVNTVPKAYGTTKLWIPNYSSLLMGALHTHVLMYVNRQTRQAQDSFTMYTFLQKSLEPSYFASVATAANEEMYRVNSNGAGILFLKDIIMDIHHDLQGKASTIRQHIVEVKFDIKAFNDHVTSQMAQLDVRGEKSTNLIEYLWKAYKAVSDTEFTKYIKTKNDAHDDGTITYDPKLLMLFALDKAELMKDQGEWLKATSEGETIIVLMTKLDTLEKSSNQLQNHLNQGVALANRAKPTS
jgi:hypothetical protein